MGKQTTDTQQNKRVPRLAKNSKIINTIFSAIQDKKGDHIVSLDLRKIDEAVADFFIICEASSTTQIKAIADHVAEKVKERSGENPLNREGYQSLQWVLLDYINVVVHVMLPNVRKFYSLEELWSDAIVNLHEEA